MPKKEPVKSEIDRKDLDILLCALFDYERLLVARYLPNHASPYAKKRIGRIHRMCEVFTELYEDEDSMPLLIDARPPDWLAESRYI